MRQEAKRRKTNSFLSTHGGSLVSGDLGTEVAGHNYTGRAGRTGGSDDAASDAALTSAPNTVERTVMYSTVALTPLRGAEALLALEEASEDLWNEASQRAADREEQGSPPRDEADDLSESDSFAVTSHSPRAPKPKKKSARLTGKEAEDLREQEAYGRSHLGWGGRCP